MERVEEELAGCRCSGAGEEIPTQDFEDYTTRQRVAVGVCIAVASLVFAAGLYTIGTMLIKGWLSLMYAMTCMGSNPFGWTL